MFGIAVLGAVFSAHGSDGIVVEEVLNCDAVRLLAERAAAVVPGFAVGAGNAAAVAGLCRQLDGIPLALELAAVRLGSLSLDQLSRGLASELSVLGVGLRGVEARQQTLEAASTSGPRACSVLPSEPARKAP